MATRGRRFSDPPGAVRRVLMTGALRHIDVEHRTSRVQMRVLFLAAGMNVQSGGDKETSATRLRRREKLRDCAPDSARRSGATLHRHAGRLFSAHLVPPPG
eukprot:CAMPEP_0170635974 /NCGR_PEP_ID=MMETSP0224-20130122/37525_1 /TAXON_ID=285029 /ORGANISM="Togula jolla, Strain CCCM 725" /LENGTH=100 /DNA_ID=CAMNT_0010965545 /DNA_START=60 /DNA_END=362 /DNA_ORIENTATION=-